MRRSRKAYKPKNCYGAYTSGVYEKPLVCVSATTIESARGMVAAWQDLQCITERLLVRKHACILPCGHTHWQSSGQPPMAPGFVAQRTKSSHVLALSRQEKMLKDLHLE